MDSYKAVSLDEQRRRIADAICAAGWAPTPEAGDYWIEEIYEGFAIVNSGGQFFRADYTVGDDDTVTVAPRDQWQEVSKEWVTKSLGLDIIRPREIKSTETSFTVGGYGIVFGGQDLEGNWFDKDTYLWTDKLGPALVLYQHGLDDAVKRAVLGRVSVERPDDVGVWIEAQIELSNQYASAIRELVRKGLLGWSSGAIPHLIDCEHAGKRVPWPARGRIASWPRVEYSLTPSPAEPRTLGVTELEEIAEAMPAVKALLAVGKGGEDTAPAKSAAADTVVVVRDRSEPQTPAAGEDDMDNEAIKSLQNEMTELKGQFSGINEQLNKLMQLIEDAPAIRKAGYFTVDGGAADPSIKSFGDFLLAIRRRDTKRLTQVYASKAIVEDSGEAGGYLVPSEYRTELLRIAGETSPIVGMCRTIPVDTDAGTWPALDQYITPEADTGQVAWAAGVTASVTAEGETFDETEPGFGQIAWRVHKIGGYTQVSNEVIADSPATIEALLQGLFGVAVAAKREFYVLRGNGVGQPLGILKAACAIGISPDTNNYFSYADALEMVSRFKSVGGTPRWVIHQTVAPDIGVWEVGTAGAGRASISDLGFGQPIYSEHLPVADSSGCVLLGDFSGYLLFVREPLSIAFSEHVGFLKDMGTWRFRERLDGQPWVKKPVTLADGSTTVSPFIYLND